MDTNVSKARAALIFRVESALHPSSTGLVIENTKGRASQFRDTENGDNE
jgi:hypothetical protein